MGNHLRLVKFMSERLAAWLVEALSVLSSKNFVPDYSQVLRGLLLQPWLAHEWRFHLADLMVSLSYPLLTFIQKKWSGLVIRYNGMTQS